MIGFCLDNINFKQQLKLTSSYPNLTPLTLGIGLMVSFCIANCFSIPCSYRIGLVVSFQVWLHTFVRKRIVCSHCVYQASKLKLYQRINRYSHLLFDTIMHTIVMWLRFHSYGISCAYMCSAIFMQLMKLGVGYFSCESIAACTLVPMTLC